MHEIRFPGITRGGSRLGRVVCSKCFHARMHVATRNSLIERLRSVRLVVLKVVALLSVRVRSTKFRNHVSSASN